MMVDMDNLTSINLQELNQHYKCALLLDPYFFNLREAISVPHLLVYGSIYFCPDGRYGHFDHEHIKKLYARI